jgi:hypothetical protein
MARFDAEVGNDLLHGLEKLQLESRVVFGEMVTAGADVALRNIRSNMRSSFKSSRSLEAGLGKTRVFDTPSDQGIAVKVGFRGYSPTHKTKKFSSGVPIPLIAVSREKGTKRGEAKKPFFKKSFNKSAIEAEMKRIEPKLFKGLPQ